MTGLSLPGAFAGALFCLGAALVWVRLPQRRRLTLTDRLAPYLRDTAPPSHLLGRVQSSSDRGWRAAALPVAQWAAARLDALLGGGPSVARRQRRLGVPADVSAFRLQQVIWGAAGGSVGAVFGVVAWQRRPDAAFFAVILVLLGAAVGVLAADYRLTSLVERRERLMAVEFPTIAELLALSVGAGEGTAAALERVCALSSGELAKELRATLADAHAGASLPGALQGLADRTGMASLARFVDGIRVALERGTPLADVLRAQAQDVREEARREVLEAAGRKEIHMLVPVVFLALPVTVLFAVFPGLAMLQLHP